MESIVVNSFFSDHIWAHLLYHHAFIAVIVVKCQQYSHLTTLSFIWSRVSDEWKPNSRSLPSSVLVPSAPEICQYDCSLITGNSS